MTELLEEVGFHQLRIDQIAERAGIPKSTIYRRWPSLHALVVTAFQRVFSPPELPSTGVALADLDSLIDLLFSELYGHPLGGALAKSGPTLLQDPEQADAYRESFITPYAQGMETLIQRGIDSGEYSPPLTAGEITRLILGGTTFQTVVDGKVPDPASLKKQLRILLGVTA